MNVKFKTIIMNFIPHSNTNFLSYISVCQNAVVSLHLIINFQCQRHVFLRSFFCHYFSHSPQMEKASAFRTHTIDSVHLDKDNPELCPHLKILNVKTATSQFCHVELTQSQVSEFRIQTSLEAQYFTYHILLLP